MLRVESLFPRSRQNGAAAVEFAIVLPLLILIFTGMVEYGRLMWNYNALAKAARDAARFLAEESDITNTKRDEARGMVVDTAHAAGVKGLVIGDVAASCDPNCTTPAKVTVDVSYAYTIGAWIPIIGPSGSTITNVTLTPYTVMRYMK